MQDSSQLTREQRLYAEGREVLLQKLLADEKAGNVQSLPYNTYLVRQCLTDLVEDIKKDSKPNPKKPRSTAFKKFAVYLGSLDPKIAALRAIQAALEAVFEAGAADIAAPCFKKAARDAGTAVYTEYLARHFKEINPPMFRALLREYSRTMTKNERFLVQQMRSKLDRTDTPYPVWSTGDIEGVGQYLVSRMVAHNLFESWSATRKIRGQVKVERYLLLAEDLRENSIDILESMSESRRVWGAMIEPPLDWDAATNSGGGFHSADAQRLVPGAVLNNGPKPVSPITVGTLNKLQQVRWQINSEVLAVVEAVAPHHSFGSVVSPLTTEKPAWQDDMTDEEKAVWRASAREWHTQKRLRASHHLSAQRVLTEARELDGLPAIWFTYFADFRGRKYAVSHGVCPQGNDLQKGAIRLADGKPIQSESAKKWFRIHGANRYGLDKLTLAEREQWVLDNDQMLVDMGANPLDHLGWMQADSPVQFLAWVMEFSRWRRDPKTLNHIACAQDGTCNGLQNYSALLCDSVGGTATNLVPGDKPRDIYRDVADKVTQLLEASPPSPLRDAWLNHKIGRSLTKRTTMTLPYGCTRFGCSTFIRDYLEENTPEGFEPAMYGDLANYMSHVIWKALDEVVVKAREAMVWLREWSMHTARSGFNPAWVTPSGLLVRNFYEKYKSTTIKSAAFQSNIRLNVPTGEADLRKIANGVAPNFIHSMDASHLDFVVHTAVSEGMVPVTIHDDFGVHAEDTERFHQIIREEFVKMYTNCNLLKVMGDKAGYPVPPPEFGNLDLNKVIDSTYFFA